jgi:hypothetical protein
VRAWLRRALADKPEGRFENAGEALLQLLRAAEPL